MLTENAELNRTFNGAFPFWLFAIFCVAALVFVWKLVPETKKKALEEMDALWEK
jgi:predicted MFS family arabinose efflux permease